MEIGRLTPQRQAVRNVVSTATDHPSAAEVYERVRDALPGIGPATVYRTLSLLVESGQVRELEVGTASSRYDGDDRPHDHAVCRDCGKVVDVRAGLPEDSARAVARSTGFRVTSYQLIFHGYCSECGAGHKQPDDARRSNAHTGR